jgi:hypothetical protein
VKKPEENGSKGAQEPQIQASSSRDANWGDQEPSEQRKAPHPRSGYPQQVGKFIGVLLKVLDDVMQPRKCEGRNLQNRRKEQVKP